MSEILIDTHFLYWWMTADPRLGATAQSLIASEAVTVSVASQWEMVLKHRRGKLPLPDAALQSEIESQGFRLLAIRPQHVDAVRTLPQGLDDPFDRLMLATAIVEGLRLLTRDRALLKFANQVPGAHVLEA